MNARSLSGSFFGLLPLASALACAVVVGCAGSAEPATASAGSDLETDASAPAPDASAADASAPARGPVATALMADLTAAGLDPKNLPALDSLDAPTLKKVMRTFTKSLGVQCSGCHDTTDFSKPTPQKNITVHMWNDFVRQLSLADGSGALYCDSCHNGQKDFLDRSSHAGLRDWMSTNFVAKLKRADGAAHNCGTCHGSPFQGDIFGALWHAE